MSGDPNMHDVPTGLQVTPIDVTVAGFRLVFRAVCEGHPSCRDGYGLRWMADSSEDLHDRIYPAFRAHVAAMAEFGESISLDQDRGLDR
ncbi:hypothetical protein [Nocardia sp. NPDC059228]|uniref:hypothetical protein n=1 Tax=Nocardia sp. NPDC059228 TaxID=3346777 RepID=UPI003679D8C2